jgi:CheY-like chemotaxis protein
MSETAFILMWKTSVPTARRSEGIERTGHACHLVESGDEAIASMKVRAPHVVDTDYTHGGSMDGMAVLRQAREIIPLDQA